MKAIVCQCVHGARLSDGVRTEFLAGLAGLPGEWTVVPDLCGAAARREEWLAKWFQGPDTPRAIVGCHARALRWMLRWAQATQAVDSIHVFNLLEQTPAEVLAALRTLAEPGRSTVIHASEPATEPPWTPWFPVIDRDRCTHCHQCKNFCPFGVYATDDVGHVEVRNPAHCKNHCPACARLCPQVAIMFPKHNQRPIDGAPVTAEDEVRRREAQREKRLNQGDIHAILARRNQQRNTEHGTPHPRPPTT